MLKFDKKEIIGMIHLSGPDTVDKAMEEIRIYEEEGLSGIIVENYHGGMLDVIDTLVALKANPTTMTVGVNILPNEYITAFDLCKTYKFVEFIQLDYVAGTYGRGVRLDWEDYARHYVASGIKVYGGVWPKYYTPIEGSDLEYDIVEGLFQSDAIVVTGSGTGMETPMDKIRTFREIMDAGFDTPSFRNDKTQGHKVPLIVGAGLTSQNVKEALSIAQGAIVGSAFKPRKQTRQMVDRDLVRVFMNEVREIELDGRKFDRQ